MCYVHIKQIPSKFISVYLHIPVPYLTNNNILMNIRLFHMF